VTQCYMWTGSRDKCGYGKMGDGQLTHRVIYAFTYPDVFDPTLEVCHACDNPGCVNPAHLWQGTHHENQRDKARKGRGQKSPRGLPFGATTNGNKFAARVKVEGKMKYLGNYATADEASRVALEFKAKLYE
jgi:hypothetical protein